jgi:hypothetical protein
MYKIFDVRVVICILDNVALKNTSDARKKKIIMIKAGHGKGIFIQIMFLIYFFFVYFTFFSLA